MELIYNETTGMWEEKKEPYAVIECVTEEDYNRVLDAVDKQNAKKPTHEATLLKCCTCPTCKNVIDKFEKFGDATVRVRCNYCHFCGQKLDWSEVE